MANEDKDVKRVTATGAALLTTIIEKQLGFATDTHILKFKAPGGSGFDYAAESENSTINTLTVLDKVLIDSDGDTFIFDGTTDDLMQLVAGNITGFELDFSGLQNKVVVSPDLDDIDFIVNTAFGEMIKTDSTLGTLTINGAKEADADTIIKSDILDNALRVDGQLGGIGINKDPSGSSTRLQIQVTAAELALIEGFDASATKIFEVIDDTGATLSLFDASGDRSVFLAGDTSSRIAQITVNSALTATNFNALILSHATSATALNNLATSLIFNIQDGGGGLVNEIAAIRGTATDVSAGAEEGSLGFYTADIGDDGLAVRMTIDKDGQVGIGTETPICALEVETTGTAGICMLIQNDNATGDPRYRLATDATEWAIGIDNNVGDQFVIAKASTLGSGSDAFIIDTAKHIFITTIRSGATQAAAGAAADELWKTSGHATLPNEVVLIGV